MKITLLINVIYDYYREERVVAVGTWKQMEKLAKELNEETGIGIRKYRKVTKALMYESNNPPHLWLREVETNKLLEGS